MFTIDNSRLSCYQDCPQKYYKKFILCLRKQRLDETDVDREFGSCFHKSIEILHSGGSLDKAKEVFRSLNPIETEKVKTPANGEKLVEAYLNYWSQPVNELSDTSLETLAVEQIIKFPLSENVEWLVKLDRVVKCNAGIFSCETKTTGKMAYNFFRKFDMSQQITGQCIAVKEKYGQCSGAIIDAVCVGYRERSYKGEPAGFHCELSRDLTNRNDEQLLDWRANTLTWANRLALLLETSKDGHQATAFPKNTEACYKFKGCQFIDLCKSCDDESVREVQYEIHNPLDYLKENENAE
jgi:hypothetical protein